MSTKVVPIRPAARRQRRRATALTPAQVLVARDLVNDAFEEMRKVQASLRQPLDDFEWWSQCGAALARVREQVCRGLEVLDVDEPPQLRAIRQHLWAASDCLVLLATCCDQIAAMDEDAQRGMVRLASAAADDLGQIPWLFLGVAGVMVGAAQHADSRGGSAL